MYKSAEYGWNRCEIDDKIWDNRGERAFSCNKFGQINLGVCC